MTKTSCFHDRARQEVNRTRRKVIRRKPEVTKTRMEGTRTRMEVTRTRRKVTRTSWEMTRTSWFPGGLEHSWDKELGRIGEISNVFDILPTHHNKLGNRNQP